MTSHSALVRRHRTQRVAGRAALVAVACIVAAAVLGPFAWMLVSSLKDSASVLEYPPSWIPDPVDLSGYQTVLDPDNAWLRYLGNSVLVSSLCAIGSLIACILVAFGFAQFQTRLGSWLFGLMVATMMVPITVTLLPSYLVYAQLGLIDTFVPLVLPAFLGQNIAGTFLLRQFFLMLPPSLVDAARIDGCGWLQVLWRIYLPNVKPALITVGATAFIVAWNDLLAPLVFLVSPANYTLPLGIATLFNTAGNIDNPGLLLAISVVGLIPVTILFFFFQRHFTQTNVASGIK